jgi:dipeptidyl aminopeptidase/acylaminoacyl peptidase
MIPPQKYSIEQFYQNTNVIGGSFSPDGSKILVSTNATGIYNAAALPTDGSDPIVLTQSTEESVFAISYLQDGERILFSADKGGNEISHLYLLEADGTSKDLAPDSTAKSQFVRWSKDRKSLFYVSKTRDPQYFDLYEMDLDNFRAVLIYENSGGLNVAAVSDDRNTVALTKSITTSNNEMYVFNRSTGEIKYLTPHEGDIMYQPQYFSQDSKNLLYLSDEDGEFTELRSYDLDRNTSEVVFSTNWDVWYAYESEEYKYRVIGINEDARTVMKIFDLQAGKEVALPDIDGRSIVSVSISQDEKLMRITAGDSRAPSDLYLYQFEGGSVTRLTKNLNPDIHADDLVEGQVIRYKSFDGLEIPSILYKPKQCYDAHTCPAIVWVHGGPGGQTRLSYFPLIQAMVNHGYVVLGVNNRGSSGYGKSFFRMDNQAHGDVDLKDCVYGKQYLQSLDYVDTSKIGIAGGSYGGYMTMAALAFTPEEFDVGVNIFGVTNWLRTLKSIPPWWGSFREALYAEMGDPNTDDSIRLYNISPVFHADKVTKPLIVLQGANDPRVLQVESDDIVAAVKANGVHVEYVVFEDEGHGFVKKENEIEGYGRVLKFLDEYLKGEGTVLQ